MMHVSDGPKYLVPRNRVAPQEHDLKRCYIASDGT